MRWTNVEGIELIQLEVEAFIDVKQEFAASVTVAFVSELDTLWAGNVVGTVWLII